MHKISYMKYLRHLIILALILFLSSGFAYADDVNGTTADSPHTFAELQELIDNSDGTVELTCDYYQDTNSIHEIKINKDITINGNNHVLDGGSSARIIYATSNVNLNDITFKNGLGQTGGAVHLIGGGINNCTFINNSVSDSCAGALYLENGYVNNSRFIDNHVISTESLSTDVITYTQCPGGAIYALDSVVENSIFINNTANVGGAVYIQGRISNSTFTGNSAYSLGGAVYSLYGSRLERLKLYRNSAYVGGAIDSQQTDMTDLYAEANQAYFGGAISAIEGILKEIVCVNNTGERGGALSLYKNTLYSSYFENNTADLGGAIEQVGSDVYECVFLSNHANEGGAVCQYVLDTSEEVKASSVHDSIFFNNTANLRGGAISQFRSEVYDSEFVANSAENGGAAYSDGSDVLNCEFRDNLAFEDGGAVYQIDHSSVSDSTFENNTALKHGGAIYESSDSSYDGCTFKNNHAGYGCDDVCIEHIHSDDSQIGEAYWWEATSKESHHSIEKSADDACGNPIFALFASLFVLAVKRRY